MRTRAACLLLGLLAAACGKTGSKNDDQWPPVSVAGSASTGGGTGPVTTVDPPLDGECTDEDRGPGRSPLSRLTSFELNRSLRALLGDFPFDSNIQWLPENSYGASFAIEEQGPPDAEYHALAHQLALRFSLNTEAVTDMSGCDPAASGAVTCQQQFLAAFLERAYRRAVTEEDVTEMSAVFAEGQKLGGDFASGVRAVVEVALHSPEFLYLLELGGGKAVGNAVALTGFESASRLAYFLTGAPPDVELLGIASKGTLSVDDLETQARRLLGTAPSRELLRHFYTQLLRIDVLRDDPEAGYSAELAAQAREATGLFVEDVTFDGAGTFRALMTEPSAWSNAALAPFYGSSAPAGSAFQKVTLDPKQRSGLYTQISFLAAGSRSTEPSPIQRAMVILRHVLCYDPPPPPAEIGVVPEPVDGTLRERLTAFTQDPACMGCHRDLNPLGFAFENYDGVGKWRDAEPKGPIDASGTLFRSDAAGDFENAVDLLARIAESGDAKACFASQWLTHAYRRVGDKGDSCARQQVTSAFAESDGNLVELLVELAKTDNFRFRLKSELAP